MEDNKISVKNINRSSSLVSDSMVTSDELIVIDAVLDVAKESMSCFTDYMNCREHEITERQRIKECLNAVLEKINVQKEMYIKTIEVNYTERKELYAKADAALKKALETQDVEMLKCIYNYILTVYNSSGNTTIQLASQFVGNSNNIIEFLR